MADDSTTFERRPSESMSDYVTRLRSRELTKDIKESRFQNCRPRDAATLLILDTSGGEPKLLMGQRHHGLKFMPGKFVFPGGRVEPQDYLATINCRMPEGMTAKLLSRIKGTSHPQRAYALAHAAVRETREETGVIIGGGADSEAAGKIAPPDFTGISYLARAITPPRRRRRFDTRFFVVPAERISGTTPIIDGEFIAVEWFTLADARRQDLPLITRLILDDLEERTGTGALDDPGAPVPFYFMRGACFHRKLL